MTKTNKVQGPMPNKKAQGPKSKLSKSEGLNFKRKKNNKFDFENC